GSSSYQRHHLLLTLRSLGSLKAEGACAGARAVHLGLADAAFLIRGVALLVSDSFSKPKTAEYLRPTTWAITKLRLIPVADRLWLVRDRGPLCCHPRPIVRVSSTARDRLPALPRWSSFQKPGRPRSHPCPRLPGSDSP